MANSVRIVEVGPRDGLQNVKQSIPTLTKIELIRRLQQTGLNTIEITSVVSPRTIPQLADCKTLLANTDVKRIVQDERLRAPVLIPNVKGLDIALENNIREIAVFVSASEGFSKANINCSVQQGLDRAKAVAEIARQRNVAVRGYVSCIFSCPYDGPTPPSAVLNSVQQLLAMGCYEISLGDTLGVGVASQTAALIKFLVDAGVPIGTLAGHFHDTYGQALANIWAAYRSGLRVFDSSVGGLGGCPYAPGAKGNVASEDVVYMFEQAGINTGVNLDRLAETGAWISEQLKKQNESRAGSALLAKSRLKSGSKESKANTTASALQWIPQEAPEGLKFFKSGTNIKIVLDRPRNGNALTTSMIEMLTAFMEKIAGDSSITRVAITANGKFFCTGMDLGKGSSPVASGQATVDAQFNRLTKLFNVISNAPQVTIACVQGPAFGGGVGLAFACDIRIFSKNANMTLSEVKLGLCPATISKAVIRELGIPFSREAMLSGRTLLPEELARLGAVAKVVSDPNAALDSYLTSLKTSAPRASGMVKDLIKLAWQEGAGPKQEEGIKALFRQMMLSDNVESAYGLKEFQRGNKKVDWDAFALSRQKVPSKL
ncbi:hypothetical protein BGW36DRAFT_431906 [Talaromyces proteolyticus]|uniref:hydroxymethylglutaryl-CoA lyase n=1 Tax=Talaromyces proteolyticus TaxID=1131652 RepID=A0AAD4PW00_9EURO|nr:uncharacterized protein BGW36DRAFT_431906 [Talaromyces proteolyticus]KAH8691357.1 hypothetical protein BGW36DRAFT_431906 [Talaromyces proteolyticus]